MSDTQNTGGKILVVDDEDRIRKIVASNLKSRGFEVIEAADGESALQFVEKETPDVILLDLMLPGIDGYEVCSRLKKNPATAGIPIIMVTAKSRVEEKVKGLDIGASDYLSKPFEINEMASRVKAAYRMKKLQDELKEANHIKDKFLAVAAHDLRSPLSTINLWGGYLADGLGKDQEEVVNAGKAINRISKQMLGLINDLLDTARLSLGVMKMKFVLVEPKIICTSIYEQYKLLVESEGISFVYSSADDLPAVMVDPDRMTEVLQNIISNAIKFTEKGGMIKMRSGRLTEEKLPSSEFGDMAGQMKKAGLENFVACEIEDSGAGISNEEWVKIFDKYVQLEKRSQKKSSGLGLAICKEIISLHNGYLWVHSELGKGSVFRFAVPIKQPDVTQNPGKNLIA